MILILSLAAPALAAEPGNGVIEGQVINGTEGASSVTDQEVTLKISLDNNEVDSKTTKTDAEGRFVFDGLATDSGYGYEVTIKFQQADYYSEQLSFNDGETSKYTEVTVYDSTTSADSVRVEMAHTVIYIEEESLLVAEYFLFVNESDRTYIGSKEMTTEGTRETLTFFLPEDATELQLGQGLMECCVYGSGDGFVDTMPVLPGGKEMIFSYLVAYDSGKYNFSQNMNYPTANYDLLVQGEGSQISSDQLMAKEPMDIGGTLFNHLSGDDLTPGDVVVTRLSGLPDTSNQGTVIWVGLTLAVLTIIFSFVYVLKRRRLQPAGIESSLKQQRQRLLVEIAQLDDAFESRKIGEEGYRKLRAGKKKQLVTLIQKAKEKSGT